MKINFKHFTDDTNTYDTAYVSGYVWSEWLEDYTIECKIINGELKTSVFAEDWMTQDEMDGINSELEPIEDSWEFIDFSKEPNGEPELYLVADSNSEMFNVLNSKQNLDNIDNMINKLNEF